MLASPISRLTVTAFVFTAMCTSYTAREPARIPSEGDLGVLRDKKIALIGFYPFDTKITDSYVSGNMRHTTTMAFLNYKTSMKGDLQFGQPIDKIESTGVRDDVSKEKIKAFVTAYLTHVKRSGIEELAQVLEMKGKSEENAEGSIKLKAHDVDYYVIGIHLPAFAQEEGATGVLTFFPFVFTMGTFPMIKNMQSEGRFLVFDKDLNLVEEFNYKGTYRVMMAWWANFQATEGNFFENKPRPVKTYLPEMKEFTSDFAKFLSEQP